MSCSSLAPRVVGEPALDGRCGEVAEAVHHVTGLEPGPAGQARHLEYRAAAVGIGAGEVVASGRPNALCRNGADDLGARNQASVLWDNGYAGSYEDVNLYWGLGYTGSRACIANGCAYSYLAGWYVPNNGSGGRETLNDNISSHVWSNSC